LTAHLKRNLMLGLALAAAAAGILLAVLPGGHRHDPRSHPRTAGSGSQGQVQLAAGYLGLSPSEVRHRLRTGATMAEIAADTPGHSKAGLLAALLQAARAGLKGKGLSPSRERSQLARMRARLVAQVSRPRHPSADLIAAAGYLGISEAGLRGKLEAGRTLAEVADSTAGHSATGLIEALLGAKRQRLELAVKNGQLSPASERMALASLRSRLNGEVHRELFKR
jgi:hypothetical protein